MGTGAAIIVGIVMCFYLLGHTADAYFTPALQVRRTHVELMGAGAEFLYAIISHDRYYTVGMRSLHLCAWNRRLLSPVLVWWGIDRYSQWVRARASVAARVERSFMVQVSLSLQSRLHLRCMLSRAKNGSQACV